MREEKERTGDIELEIQKKKSGDDHNDIDVAVDDTAVDELHASFLRISLSTYFSDAFTWLEAILYYSPTWIPKQTNTETSKTKMNYILLSLSIGFVLLYVALQYFYQITRWYLYSNIDNIIWCCYIVFISSSRLLSIIYCYKYFNWPWNPENHPFQPQLETGTYQKLIVRFKIIYIVMCISYIVIDIAVIILETTALLAYYHDSLLTYILVKSMCRIFLAYPLMITIMIHSIIVLKHCICLHQLYKSMEDISNVNLPDIFERYDKLYKLFKRDRHKTLVYSIRFYLASEVLFFWDSLNFIGMFVMVVIAIRELPIFILYFYPASILEGIHRKFSKKLWKNPRVFLNNNDNNNHDGCYYNSILHYIQHCPIYVKVGSVVISKKTVAKFTFYLLLSRGIAYALRHWLQENYW